MILTKQKIVEALYMNTLSIRKYNPNQLGPNSYDATLSPILYKVVPNIEDYFDIALPTQYERIVIPKSGYILEPGILYLGSTMEWTSTPNHVPMYDGRSSIGRVGIRSHQTAGFGDKGFSGYWTLEIDVIMRTKIYPLMPIGQFSFHEVDQSHKLYEGGYNNPYDGSKYPEPIISNINKKLEALF